MAEYLDGLQFFWNWFVGFLGFATIPILLFLIAFIVEVIWEKSCGK